MRPGLIAAAMLLASPHTVLSQGRPEPTGFLDRSVESGGRTYPYQVYIPRSYDPNERWPVVRSLHGAAGGVRYTELEGVGHNAWDPAYGSQALPAWLLAQRRP